MKLGKKIKKYRLLQNMTQKELGQKVGFSAATADSRIRKYEKDLMAPKEGIRQKLCDALDVDQSALSDIDIKSYEDVMQVLFLFEDELGAEIERTDEKTYLVLENNNSDHSRLMSYLYAWFVQKKNLPQESDETSQNTRDQYQKWQARFPRDLLSYWDEQEKTLNKIYEPLVSTQAAKQKKVERLSEFLLHIRILLQTNLKVNLGTVSYGTGDIALKIAFPVSKLIDETESAIKKAFTSFLCDIADMKEYGMPCYTEMSSDESGTKISYILRWSPLPAFKSLIIKMQEHESEKATLSDLEIASFEKSLEYDLETFDLNLKEEIMAACANSK